MKKIFAAVLAMVLLLGLCACEAAADPNAGKFCVGYGREDITPTESVPLAGYGNTSRRMSVTEYEWPFDTIYSTCIAFTDADGNTVLLVQNDLFRSFKAVSDEARNAISEKTGIPRENIMVAGTHTHAAPDMDNTEQESITRYKVILLEKIVKAATAALEDRKPAQMYVASAETTNMNFVRHYNLDQGGVRGDNFGSLLPGNIVSHTHDVDNVMQVVKFTREGGKDIVMVNWQSQLLRGTTGKKLYVSADLAGVIRETIESELDCLSMYVTGASANVNPNSRINKENITENYIVQGQLLTEYATDALKNATKVETGKVQIVGQTYAGQVDHTEDHLLDAAKAISDHWKATNNNTECTKMGEKYGINSPYHAEAIIEKYELGATLDVEMYAFSVGDLAFVAAPYDMFDENGAYIKKESPFKMTFVTTFCNDHVGFAASEEGYENDSFEANTSNFIKGTGETLAQEYVKLLQQLYPTK